MGRPLKRGTTVLIFCIMVYISVVYCYFSKAAKAMMEPLSKDWTETHILW
jgi:hypothetical protein